MTIAMQLADRGLTVPYLPHKWHDAETLRCNRKDYDAPEGWFVDWQSEEARSFVFMVRSTIRPMPTVAAIAEEFHFQHWIRTYNAYNCIAARNRAERRTPHIRPDDQRRYVRRRYVQVLPDGTIDRSFGCEIEFSHPESRPHQRPVNAASLAAILRGLRAAGHTAHAMRSRGVTAAHDGDWQGYGWSPTIGGWQGTHDVTIGPELVSPPLPVTNDGLDQLTLAFRLIRDNGGSPAAGAGLHVHVGCGDLDTNGRVRLVENVRAADRFLTAYVPQSRRNGGPQGYSAPMSSYTWDAELRNVAAGRNGGGSHSAAYNFGHIVAEPGRDATVEFRAMGHTLNAGKQRVWIRVVAALVNATAAGHRLVGVHSVADFTAWLVANGGLSTVAAARFNERANGRHAIAA